MTQSWQESANLFEPARPSRAGDGQREPVRTRRMSLPLLMDDGQVRSFDVPAALDHPSQFSVSELERLTRAYEEALRLLPPSAST